ncbi:MAG: flavodoxin family protein [Deltaproteobacteria bacterium]|nr:flavodoxin family protein [Deltaproteobacteria bacterium]
MNSTRKVVGIVGSYRKNGITDSVVTEILSTVASQECKTEKIYLLDKNIAFCTNCRACLQVQGAKRGKCILEDDMEEILQKIESAYCIVLGAPVNFGNINALTRKFLERCVGYAYWPWGKGRPVIRNKKAAKKAILVSASAAPAWAGRTFSGGLGGLKKLAQILGAKPVGVLWVGLVNKKDMQLSDKTVQKARALGRKLATFRCSSATKRTIN